MFLMGIPVMSLWGLYGPAAQALMTERVGRSAQGALQGALASLQTATGIFGPALFSETFAAAISSSGWHVPGAPFLLASMFLVAGVVRCASCGLRGLRPSRPCSDWQSSRPA